MRVLLKHVQRLDLARLAGITSVLGIDLDGTSAHIVPLTKRGNPLDRYKATFSADAPLTCHFPEGSDSATKGPLIKEALRARSVKARHCVATVRSAGVRTVAVTVPAGVQDPGEWIGEHAGKILKLPIALSELELSWEVLEASSSCTSVEVVFVRKAELEELRAVIKHAGLRLLAISAGVRDALNALLVTDPAITEKDLTIAYAEGEHVTLMPVRRGKRQALVRLPGGLDDAARAKLEGEELLFAGARSFADTYPQDKELKPYNLTPEYTLATGLALKGFLPELQGVDLLSESERETNKVSLWQTLFKRTAVALGAFLFLVLAIETAASYTMEIMSGHLEEEMSSSQGTLAEVTALRDRVRALETQLTSAQRGASRGSLAPLLHRLASSVPPSVRLDRLECTAEGGRSAQLSLTSSARSREAVAGFLKELEEAGFTGVTLIRLSSGEALQTQTSLVKAELEFMATAEAQP